ncbi:MAG: efflux RND transporter permease subunit [Gemmatimonadales bacterium]
MMGLVRIALRRPYTFVAGAILILIVGLVAIRNMAVDIFPTISIPVVTVIWTFNGMSPEEMEQRIVTTLERSYSAFVNDVEHIESQSMNGVAVIKVYFQPTADIPTGVAQITAASQSNIRSLPPGITPPIIVRLNATDVPILQIGVGSSTMSSAELGDYVGNFLRTPLATVPGATLPSPYGGAPRLINVDIDPSQLYAKGLSPSDVSDAINAQNVILPAGSARLGSREYNVRLNSSPSLVDQLNEMPIKIVNGAMVYIGDVAHVRDGAGVQTNIVRQNGRAGTYLSVLKNGNASSLAVVNGIKAKLASIKASLPPSLDIQLLADQSIYVRAAITGVIREALIAACLTAFMILVFLGSWRSTLIIATSIPLAILCSIIALWGLGQTLNVMTLGGLALAVGILVDDATVEIENVNRNMAEGKEILQAIMDGAAQIATPAFVSTLAISIVFLPIFFLTGPAAALFRSLALAVVFAVMASYVLSRTLVPTMARYLLAADAHRLAAAAATGGTAISPSSGRFGRLSARFEAGFERFRAAYHGLLDAALRHRGVLVTGAGIFLLASAALVPFVGQDFFPSADGGAFQLHLRAAAGTRLEETELLFSSVERSIRRVIPPNELTLVLDNIGVNRNAINLATGSNATLNAADGDLLVQLAPKRSASTFEYVRRLRAELPREFPGVGFFFLPADIVNQVLNLGLPAPVDVQVAGPDKMANYRVASRLANEIRRIPGAVDTRVQQVANMPEFLFSVDRIRAQQIGLTQREVASDLLISLSSSGQTAPNFWLNPQNGVSYSVAVRTPTYQLTSLADLARTPVTAPGLPEPQLFGNLASVSRQTSYAVVNHYNVQPVTDIYAGADDRDLGGVARDIDRVIAQVRPTLPKGTSIVVRGQVESMRSSFRGLLFGVVFAMVLVYLLLVINFQSWLDPLVIIMALPGALAGVVWILFATGTTFSVPALMGMIMVLGVATANSVLLVTFADEQRREGRSALQAALAAGFVRLRPVCMTALAMILGMLPMALAFGEGAQQNAPLGRAVIGGLLVATIFTLFVVPVMYSLLRAAPPAPPITIPEGHA